MTTAPKGASVGIAPRPIRPGEVVEIVRAVTDAHKRVCHDLTGFRHESPKADRDRRVARLRALAIQRGEFRVEAKENCA